MLKKFKPTPEEWVNFKHKEDEWNRCCVILWTPFHVNFLKSSIPYRSTSLWYRSTRARLVFLEQDIQCSVFSICWLDKHNIILLKSLSKQTIHTAELHTSIEINANCRLSGPDWFRCIRVKKYRSGTVNSKSFVGKVLLRIKRKFELN